MKAAKRGDGNWSIFVTRPISLIFLLIAVLSVSMTIKKTDIGREKAHCRPIGSAMAL